MPIRAPGRRINPSIARRNSSEGRKSVYHSLSLTSMVDMFAIMVIFLLQSFSSEGEIIVLPKEFQLPQAKNTGTLERAPTILIGRDEILLVEKNQLEGEVVAQTEQVRAAGEWNIPVLQQKLVDFKAQLEAEAIALRDIDPDAVQELDKINISADKRLEFQVVKKVIYTAGFAGFPNFRFSVIAGKGIDALKNPEGIEEPKLPEPY